MVLAMALEFIFSATLDTLFPHNWPQWSDHTALDCVSTLPVTVLFKEKASVSDGIKELR